MARKLTSRWLEFVENFKIKWAPISSRYQLNLSARIRCKTDDLIGEILNISETGCFAVTHHHLEVGTLVGIDFKYENLDVHAVAVVVRNCKKPFGSGFVFVASTRWERQSIKNLIKRLEKKQTDRKAA